NEMCLPDTIEKLHKSIEDLEVSNDKLDTAKQALRQSEKLAHMGQLSAGIAHELNNPLGVVIMYTNILLDECKDNPEMKEDLELIVHQSERCKKIVSGLLNFARKNQVRFEDVDIEKLAKLSLNSIIVPRNIKTTFISNLSDSMASVDNEQIMQVLTNLNKNAIEAMPNGGELNITLNKNNNDVIFIIEDTGIGIPKESMDKLFTPFYTTKGIGKGTGLGLATTYGIVKMHKGKIEVESNNNPDKGKIGTRFIITIPKHQ
ncbi:MAG: HAMP domain-containing histidine kinase, partial [Bacteroidales bacterium]|nr:HAMP domain-containing histidine kinase [Bacteroidales bacterium]